MSPQTVLSQAYSKQWIQPHRNKFKKVDSLYSNFLCDIVKGIPEKQVSPFKINTLEVW